MDDFLVKLNLLYDMLMKKKEMLSQIYNITENQRTVLQTKDLSQTMHTIFNEMGKEKQILIEEVIKIDDVFQLTFNKLKAKFEHQAINYKDEVRKLQNEIKEVMDFDIKIRVLEEKNKLIIEASVPRGRINVPKASKKYVLEQYNKNKKN